jgi:hypothetical protein
VTLALVIGGSRGVWTDLERAQGLAASFDTIIVATNFAGRDYEAPIDAWATLHPEMFAEWRATRAESGRNTDYRAFTHRRHGGLADIEVHPLGWSGSSGLYAAQVAVEALGCTGVILCGVPLDGAAGHYAEPGDWTLAEKYKPAFLAAKEGGLPVRSMSGWTRELFGEPDLEWLDSLGIGPARPRARKASEITMRIKMLKTRNFTPAEERRITVKYLSGEEYTVKAGWGEALVKDGDAEEVAPPPRHPLDHDGNGAKGGAKAKAD